jgi:cytochrome P450
MQVRPGAVWHPGQMALPGIVPMPPIAGGVGLPWDQPVGDAVAAIAAARKDCGDTFVIDSGRDRYLFTFSPRGVAEFYGLPEDRASKGVADWRMLRRKLPDEIFDGRRTFPHDLFGRSDAASYLANVHRALDATVADMGSEGTVDLFDMSRRLGHRVGLASWGGPGSAEEPALASLIGAFDALDGADAFVHPDVMAAVAANSKAAERTALAAVTERFAEAARAVEADRVLVTQHPLFARIVSAWSTETGDVRYRGIGHDVALVHVASMSNLFAALGWVFVDLLSDRPAAVRVAAGESAWAEQCALESIRLAQRSIMSRFVLEPVTIGDGEHTYRVPSGVTIATLLPLTNASAGPGLETWDPTRWNRRRLTRPVLAAPELVTSFGHGRHTCPAQPFSLAAISATVARLLSNFHWEPRWAARPQPVPAQIGGVARADGPCPATYRRLRSAGAPSAS